MSIHADFSEAMALCLRSKKYQVGVTPTDIDLKKDVSLARLGVKVLGSLLNSDAMTFVGGGASSEQVVKALAPFVPLTNLIGLKLSITQQALILVVFADRLDSDEVIQRFNQFLELANDVSALGMQVNFQSAGIYVFPLLVYFDSAAYSEKVPVITQSGFKYQVWRKNLFRAGFINVPQKSIVWAEMSGVVGKIAPFWTSIGLGGAYAPFTDEDLKTVFSLATQHTQI